MFIVTVSALWGVGVFISNSLHSVTMCDRRRGYNIFDMIGSLDIHLWRTM